MKNIRTTIVMICVAILLAGCATKSAYFKLDPGLNTDIRLVNGYQYVPLSRLCDVYGINCKWDTFTRTASISKSGCTITLRADSGRILINGIESSIDHPAVIAEGTIYVPLSFVRNNLAPMISYRKTIPASEMIVSQEPFKRYAINSVVLDIGHGGKDAGAVSKYRGTKEKDIAFKIAMKVKKALEDAGLRVIMTRSSDVFIPLQGRSSIANKSSADLFVSIHINASRSQSLRGFEVYYLSNATDDNSRAIEAFENSALKLGDSADSENSTHLSKTLWDMTLTENRAESGELANYISKAAANNGIMTRGVKTARFYVLKHTNIPSVLVECGYISNKADEANLRDEGYQDKIVNTIAQGVMQYKNVYEKTEGFT